MTSVYVPVCEYLSSWIVVALFNSLCQLLCLMEAVILVFLIVFIDVPEFNVPGSNVNPLRRVHMGTGTARARSHFRKCSDTGAEKGPSISRKEGEPVVKFRRLRLKQINHIHV